MYETASPPGYAFPPTAEFSALHVVSPTDSKPHDTRKSAGASTGATHDTKTCPPTGLLTSTPDTDRPALCAETPGTTASPAPNTANATTKPRQRPKPPIPETEHPPLAADFPMPPLITTTYSTHGFGTTQQPPTETKPHEDHDPEKHADYPTARVTVTV